MEESTPSTIKQKFFVNNVDLRELEFEQASLGNLHDISEDNHDIWLLQCPKNVSISQLNEQKLKLPGRTNCGEVETVAMEMDEEKVCVFGYANRKRKKCLRLLPIQGTIVVRQRLQGKKPIDIQDLNDICPPPKRVPMPDVKVRHPLLGIDYMKKTKVKKEIMEKLRSADVNNLKITRELMIKSESTKAVNTADQVGKKRKLKTDLNDKASKKSKSSLLSPKKEELDIADDLKWLRQV